MLVAPIEMEVPKPRISDIVNPPTPGSERLPFAPNLDITKIPGFLMQLLQLADPTGMMLGGVSQGMKIPERAGTLSEGLNLLKPRVNMPVLGGAIPTSVASRAQQNPLSQALFQKQFEPTGAALQKLTGVPPSEELSQALFKPQAVKSSIASPREAAYARSQSEALRLQKQYPGMMKDVEAKIEPESWGSTPHRTYAGLHSRMSEYDPFGITKGARTRFSPDEGFLPYPLESAIGHEYEGHRVMNFLWDQEARSAKLSPVEMWQLRRARDASMAHEGVAEWVSQQQAVKAGLDRTPVMGHGAKQNKVYTQLEQMPQYDNPITTARNYIKNYISDFKKNTLPTMSKKETIPKIMDEVFPHSGNVGKGNLPGVKVPSKTKYTDEDIKDLFDGEMRKIVGQKKGGSWTSRKGGGMKESDIPKVKKEDEGIPRPSKYDPKTGERTWEFNQPRDLKFENRTTYQQERYSSGMQPEDEMIVATKGGKDVGMIWVRKKPDGGFTISRIAVDKPYQRQGVASELMREAESKFGKSRGATTAYTPEGEAFTKGRATKSRSSEEANQPRTKVEGHHTLPIGGSTNMDSLDWHLRNLWETPGSPGGYRTIEDVPPDVHKILTRLMRTKPKLESRQEGGPVQGGQPYVVGEQGPEVIVPQQSGQVIPNKPNLLQNILKALGSALDNSGKHAPPYMQPGLAPELKQQMIDREGFRGYDSPWPYCADHNKVYMKAAERLQEGGPMTPGKPYIVGEQGPELVIPDWAKSNVGRGMGNLLPEQFAPQTGGITLSQPESKTSNPKLNPNTMRGVLNSLWGTDAWGKACEWYNKYEQL